MNKLLYISMCLPYDSVGHAGGKTLNYYISRFIRDGFDITLISKVLDNEKKYVDLVTNKIINFIPIYRIKNKCKILFNIFKIINSKFNPFNHFGNTLTQDIYDRIKIELIKLKNNGYNPDVIMLEWTQILLYINVIKKIFPNSIIIASEYDVTYLGLLRKYKYSNFLFTKIINKIKYIVGKKNELQAIKITDFVVVQSKKDKELLISEGIDRNKIGVISPFYDFFDIPYEKECHDIVFYGAMNRKENSLSALWFIDNVMPMLKNTNIRFLIVGNKPEQQLLNRVSKNVIVTGFVDNPIEYFKNAMCFVMPLVLGAGIKVKVLEAFSTGKPVLTNDIGNEGIDAIDEEIFFYCKTPEDYYNKIIMLYNKEINTKKIYYNSKIFLKNNFNYDNSYIYYKNIIKTLLRGKK